MSDIFKEHAFLETPVQTEVKEDGLQYQLKMAKRSWLGKHAARTIFKKLCGGNSVVHPIALTAAVVDDSLVVNTDDAFNAGFLKFFNVDRLEDLDEGSHFEGSTGTVAHIVGVAFTQEDLAEKFPAVHKRQGSVVSLPAMIVDFKPTNIPIQ